MERVDVKTIEDFKQEGIKVEGRIGTWYAIYKETYKGELYLTLESEQFGDEADWIVVNAKNFEEANEEITYQIIYGN